MFAADKTKKIQRLCKTCGVATRFISWTTLPINVFAIDRQCTVMTMTIAALFQILFQAQLSGYTVITLVVRVIKFSHALPQNWFQM